MASTTSDSDELICNKCSSREYTELQGVIFCTSCGNRLTPSGIRRDQPNARNQQPNQNHHENTNQSGAHDHPTNDNISSSVSALSLPNGINTSTNNTPNKPFSTPNKYYDNTIHPNQNQSDSPLQHVIYGSPSNNKENDVNRLNNKGLQKINTPSSPPSKTISSLPPSISPSKSTPPVPDVTSIHISTPNGTNPQNHNNNVNPTSHTTDLDVITLRPSEYESHISAAVAEAQTKHNAELHILNEYITSLEREKGELTVLVNEAISSYENMRLQNDHTSASKAVTEVEVERLVKQLHSEKHLHATAKQQVEALHIELENSIRQHKQVESEYVKLQGEYNHTKQQFDEVTDQAHIKLSEAAELYTQAVQSAQHAQNQLNQLTNEHKKLQSSHLNLTSQQQQSDRRIQDLQSEVQSLSNESHTLNNELSHVKQQSQQYYAELMDLRRDRDDQLRQKNALVAQMVEYKEQIRVLEGASQQHHVLQQEMTSMRQENERLKVENKNLKSNLFDAMSSSTGSPDILSLQSKISSLTSELSSKESELLASKHELAELSAVLTPLIEEVEQLREAQQK